jgi:hypothetical protein
MTAPAPTTRKAFLQQIKRMGWSVKLLPTRRHFMITKAGTVIIAADHRAYVADTLARLEHADRFRRWRRRT